VAGAGVGLPMSRRSLPLLLGVFGLLLAVTAGQEPEEDLKAGTLWIEHYDKASGKKFYYSQETRETAWEAPLGARVQYMDGSGDGGAQGGGGSADATGGSSNTGFVLLAMLLPIVVPIAGLLICYWHASKEGLADVLKAMKAKRDKSHKRRGTKAGSNFRQRQKLSQDGKGGRSANS